MAISQYKLFSIEPPLDLVLSRLGYRKFKTEIDKKQLEMVTSAISESLSLLHPAGNVLTEKIDRIEDSKVVLANGFVIPSAKLAGLFRNCRTVSALACTIGSEIESAVAEANSKEELTRAVLLDAVGSEAVEAFVEYVQGALVQKQQMLGYRPTMRFSPGYGDLPTSIHPGLLALLEADKLGIACHPESFLLDPQKSVTAFIGWEKS